MFRLAIPEVIAVDGTTLHVGAAGEDVVLVVNAGYVNSDDHDVLAHVKEAYGIVDAVEDFEVSATPAATAAAEEVGVDLTAVEGTGADGKITKADVVKTAKGE